MAMSININNFVDQTVMHDPESGLYGDCGRACIATLLGLQSSNVPHFLINNDPFEFCRLVNEFLAHYGLYHLETHYYDFDRGDSEGAVNCYHMIYGKTERGTNHAVVTMNGKMIHDPHPSKDGLLESDRENWLFGFLVAAGPIQLQSNSDSKRGNKR